MAVGLGIVAWVVPLIWPDPPLWVTVPFLVLGIALFAHAGIGFIAEKWSSSIANRPDWQMFNALDYLITESASISSLKQTERHYRALQAIRQAASDGDISVWGRQMRLSSIIDDVLVPIDKMYWQRYMLSPSHCWAADAPNGCRTEADFSDGNISLFAHVQVNKQQVMRHWRPKPISQRAKQFVGRKLASWAK